jgi:hypothetical protein
MVQPLQKIIWQFLKVIITDLPPNLALLLLWNVWIKIYTCNKMSYRCQKSTIIHSSQKAETIKHYQHMNKWTWGIATWWNTTCPWKRNVVLIDATMWMNPENIILSERIQAHTTWLHWYEMSRMGKLEKGKSFMVAQGWGGHGSGDWLLILSFFWG